VAFPQDIGYMLSIATNRGLDGKTPRRLVFWTPFIPVPVLHVM